MPNTSPTGYGPSDRPERIAERWVAAWNALDADGIARLFDAEAEFVNVTGLWWHSRDAIRRAHAYGFETIFADSTISVLDTASRWLAGSPEDTGPAVAVVHAKMKLEGLDRGLRMEDCGWRIGDCGWANLGDSELLAAAVDSGFSVLITIDSHLTNQQHPSDWDLGGSSATFTQRGWMPSKNMSTPSSGPSRRSPKARRSLSLTTAERDPTRRSRPYAQPTIPQSKIPQSKIRIACI